MKALITGGGGMLAHALVPALEGAGHEALALTRPDADVTRADALAHSIRLIRPDWIFHLAAFTKVDDCEARPDHAFLVNGLGARNTALAAANCGATVIAISTDYVFDGYGTTPYREYSPAAPRSVYGASKWAGEQAVREVTPRHMVVRTSWLYGKGGTNFVDTILKKAQAGDPLKVVDDQRGSPTWTHDLAAGLVALAATGMFGTYHVTNSGECTWYDLAAHVLESARVSTALEPTTSAAFARPAPRPAYSVLSNQFFEHVTGTRMPHWQDAVKRYLDSKTTTGSAGTTAGAGSR